MSSQTKRKRIEFDPTSVFEVAAAMVRAMDELEWNSQKQQALRMAAESAGYNYPVKIEQGRLA